MINYEQALKMALAKLSELSNSSGKEIILINDQTLTTEYGWIFFYNSKAYLETGNWKKSILGHAPFIINKDNSEITFLGTAHSVEHYIKEYEKKHGFS